MNDSKLCYTVILGKEAGQNIGIIKQGMRGYALTDFDWGTGSLASTIVRERNKARGIDEAEQLDYEIKSMFIWPKA